MARPSEWERLGALMLARRVELGYANRSKFAEAKGLTPTQYRLMMDLENAKRANFTRSTLSLVEAAYEWAPGSVERILAGGEPIVRRPLTAPVSAVETRLGRLLHDMDRRHGFGEMARRAASGGHPISEARLREIAAGNTGQPLTTTEVPAVALALEMSMEGVVTMDNEDRRQGPLTPVPPTRPERKAV